MYNVLFAFIIAGGLGFTYYNFGEDSIQTFNVITNNDLLQANTWTIQKDYDFKNPNARQTLINDVSFDTRDMNKGNV